MAEKRQISSTEVMPKRLYRCAALKEWRIRLFLTLYVTVGAHSDFSPKKRVWRRGKKSPFSMDEPDVTPSAR